jgi:hypothetical protein
MPDKPDYREHEQRRELIEEISEQSPELGRELEEALKVIDKLPTPWRWLVSTILKKEVENQYPAVKDN